MYPMQHLVPSYNLLIQLSCRFTLHRQVHILELGIFYEVIVRCGAWLGPCILLFYYYLHYYYYTLVLLVKTCVLLLHYLVCWQTSKLYKLLLAKYCVFSIQPKPFHYLCNYSILSWQSAYLLKILQNHTSSVLNLGTVVYNLKTVRIEIWMQYLSRCIFWLNPIK